MSRIRTVAGIVLIVMLVFVPFFVFAQDGGGSGSVPTGSDEGSGSVPTGPGGGSGSVPTGPSGDVPGLTNPLKAKTVSQLLVAILGVARSLGFIVAIFFIVYAGFLFVTARGNDEKLQRAKKAFLWAIVGTAVLLGAQVFATIIEGTVDKIEARDEYHIVRGATAPLQDTNHFV